LRASTTRVGASTHHVVSELLAVLGACLTHLGADLARPQVVLRPEQHEAGTCVADLCAGHQHADVFRCRVLSAEFKAVTNRFEADFLTSLAAVDTFLHSIIHLVWHRSSPRG